MAEINRYNTDTLMEYVIWQIILSLATAAIGWLFGKLQTKREQKKTDLQIINDSLTPLLTSIQSLTEYNNKLVLQYLDEQKGRLAAEEQVKALIAERDNLSKEVSRLTVKVDKLEKAIKKITKNDKEPPDSD